MIQKNRDTGGDLNGVIFEEIDVSFDGSKYESEYYVVTPLVEDNIVTVSEGAILILTEIIKKLSRQHTAPQLKIQKIKFGMHH